MEKLLQLDLNMNQEKDLFLMLGEMRGDIKSINEKFDTALKNFEKVSTEVSSIMKWRDNLIGKISVIVVVFGAVWTYVWQSITK